VSNDPLGALIDTLAAMQKKRGPKAAEAFPP
jgi:hypothetical protein